MNCHIGFCYQMHATYTKNVKLSYLTGDLPLKLTIPDKDKVECVALWVAWGTIACSLHCSLTKFKPCQQLFWTIKIHYGYLNIILLEFEMLRSHI